MIIWRLLTIIFGALPATMLSIFAVVGLFCAFLATCLAILTGDMEALAWGSLLVLWFGSGIYGTFSLLECGLGFPTKWAKLGLVAGTIAISPLVWVGIRGGVEFDLYAVFFLGPVLIACGWFLLFLLGVPNEHHEVKVAASLWKAGGASR